MGSAPQFIDISTYQPENIDWTKYLPWAAQWDGTARVSIRSSYGCCNADDKYKAHLNNVRAAARSLGIPLVVIHYHYAYPEDCSAVSEANCQASIVGDLSAYPNDELMLDYEENVGQATAQWAVDFEKQQHINYPNKELIYASQSYVGGHLQDSRLPGEAGLVDANWQFTPDERPPAPAPWTSNTAVQWTDQDSSVPGVPEAVDANIWLGGNVGGDSSLATWLPCKNFWSGGNTKTFVVVHSTASCGQQTARDLATGSEFNDGASASVHYINGRDNSADDGLFQVVRESDAAWGNCCVFGPECPAGVRPTPGDSNGCHLHGLIPNPGHNYNFDTISIENMKSSCDNSEPLTAIQYARLVSLVRDICVRNNIPMIHAVDGSLSGGGGIIGHFDLDPPNRARCPGNLGVSWDQFISDVRSGIVGVPAGWSDDGTTLTAPNGITVVLGFRNEVLNASPQWDGADVPEEEEHHEDQVLMHRPDLGGGQVQLFRDHMLWWTDAKGVVDEKELGLEIFLRNKKIADLEAQLAAGNPPPSPSPAPCPPADTSKVKADLDSALASGQAALTALQQAETDLSKL